MSRAARLALPKGLIARTGHTQFHDTLIGDLTDHPVEIPLADLTAARSRRLTRAALDAAYDTDLVVAGFHVPERSVDTQLVADRFVAAGFPPERVAVLPNTAPAVAEPALSVLLAPEK